MYIPLSHKAEQEYWEIRDRNIIVSCEQNRKQLVVTHYLAHSCHSYYYHQDHTTTISMVCERLNLLRYSARRALTLCQTQSANRRVYL